MAKKGYFVQDGITYAVDAPLPIDISDKEAWTGEGAWPPGAYRAKILGISFGVNEKSGNTNALVLLENVCGPDEREDMAGEQMRQYFTVKSANGEKAANFFVGFLKNVNPEGIKPENLLKGKQPHAKYFAGALIEFTMAEETYTNADGEEKTTTKMRRGSVKCIELPASAKGNSKTTAAAEEDAMAAFTNAAE